VVAINPTPVAPPTATQKATITLNGTRTSGNTSTTSASMNMDYTFRYLTHRFNSKLHWAYGEDEEVISKRTTGAELKYDFFPREGWYLYTNFSARNDRFADLSLRTTAGIGAGIQLLDSAEITWSQESGISALNEDFISALDEATNTLRVAGDIQWSIGKQWIEVFHDHTLFISLDDPSNILAEGRLGLRTRIIGGLSLNSQINIRHDSEPPPGIEQDDIEILLGLGYSTSF
jgi:putative salt-induced outer membrane protein YdiY